MLDAILLRANPMTVALGALRIEEHRCRAISHEERADENATGIAGRACPWILDTILLLSDAMAVAVLALRIEGHRCPAVSRAL
jgi:hypothetical protein